MTVKEIEGQKIKALVLLSGGLDSRLAMKLVKNEGVELDAISFVTIFCNCTSKGSCKLEAQKAADEEGISVKVINVSQDFLETIKSPKYGYGSGMNPCIDCRIQMFKKAKEYMQEIGASFVVTGEVLGERPMSQRLEAIKIIERESGLEGNILRPLSARLFPPSNPEKSGWVTREKLLAIKGRTRKPQIELAKELGVNDYPCPAGGCLLTDANFSKKIRDLLKYGPFTVNDVQLLKLGRHFRIDAETKVVVGRDAEENQKLLTLAGEQDLLLELSSKPGPLTLVRGKSMEVGEKVAAGLTVYYSKSREAQKEEVKVYYKGGEERRIESKALSTKEVEEMYV